MRWSSEFGACSAQTSTSAQRRGTTAVLVICGTRAVWRSSTVPSPFVRHLSSYRWGRILTGLEQVHRPLRDIFRVNRCCWERVSTDYTRVCRHILWKGSTFHWMTRRGKEAEVVEEQAHIRGCTKPLRGRGLGESQNGALFDQSNRGLPDTD